MELWVISNEAAAITSRKCFDFFLNFTFLSKEIRLYG